MPRLILLNGPPAVGKSTIAKLLVDPQPMALRLDVDEIRGMLGQWQYDLTAAGLRARALTAAMTRVQLRAGGDVVIPQCLGEPEFVDELADVASQEGAVFHHVMLWCSAAESSRRFTERAERSADAEQLARVGGRRLLQQLHERLSALLAVRPDTSVVPSRPDQVEQTYRQVLTALGPPVPPSTDDD